MPWITQLMLLMIMTAFAMSGAQPQAIYSWDLRGSSRCCCQLLLFRNWCNEFFAPANERDRYNA